MQWYWQDLAWICYTLFFENWYQSYGPWFTPKFRFRSISWELTYFHQILYMHSYWQDLGWDCYMSFIRNLYQSYGPLFTPEVPFHSISWKQMDRISPNFIYIFILSRSPLWLLHIIFRLFLWSLINAKISFSFNILSTNGQNITKFYICIHIDKIYVGIVTY